MAVSASYHYSLTAAETLALGLDLAANVDASHVLESMSATINAGTTVPATQVFSDQRTLASGTENVNLNNLAGPMSTSMDWDGLRVQAVGFRADAGNNATGLTINAWLTKGYPLFGHTQGRVKVFPGCGIFAFHNDKCDLVDNVTKYIIEVSGTIGDIYEMLIVAG